jgi:hypothetical protein
MFGTELLAVIAFAATALNLLLLVALLVIVRANIRRHGGNRSVIDSLQSDLAVLCKAAVGVDRRITRLEQQQKLQHERQDKLELRDSGMQSYGQAAKLVQKGADINELMDTCGLSFGEAELIKILHQQGRH